MRISPTVKISNDTPAGLLFLQSINIGLNVDENTTVAQAKVIIHEKVFGVFAPDSRSKWTSTVKKLYIDGEDTVLGDDEPLSKYKNSPLTYAVTIKRNSQLEVPNMAKRPAQPPALNAAFSIKK
jgi:hypothetical protein